MTAKPSHAVTAPEPVVSEVGAPPALGFDITRAAEVALREDQGITVHVKNEMGEPLFYQANGSVKPVTVRLVGTYSTIYRRAVEAQRRRQFQLMKQGADLEPEHIDHHNLEVIASCMLGWDGFNAGGESLAFSRENAMQLLQQVPWFRTQMEAAANNHARFFANASPDSSKR